MEGQFGLDVREVGMGHGADVNLVHGASSSVTKSDTAGRSLCIGDDQA